jgi:hypothetical protein
VQHAELRIGSVVFDYDVCIAVCAAFCVFGVQLLLVAPIWKHVWLLDKQIERVGVIHAEHHENQVGERQDSKVFGLHE